MKAFWKLHRLRTSGLNGPDPLQPRAIREWCELTHTALTVEEAEIILAMDGAYRAAWQAENQPQDETEEDADG